MQEEPDYKELFYRSQAKMVMIIHELDQLSGMLKHFMDCCEEEVIGVADDGQKKSEI